MNFKNITFGYWFEIQPRLKDIPGSNIHMGLRGSSFLATLNHRVGRAVLQKIACLATGHHDPGLKINKKRCGLKNF